MAEPVRVAVVDNHPRYREGIVMTINEAPDFKVIAQGACGNDAVRIAQLCLPDLILLDENIPAGGIETAREISKICPFVKTVMLTIWEGTEHATAGRDADVCICIAKGVSGADLLATLRSEVFKDRESRDSVF